VPEWFDELAASTDDTLRKLEGTEGRYDRERSKLAERLAEARQHRAEADRLLDPHRPALEEVSRDVDDARRRVRSANAQLSQSSALKRRGARRSVDEAQASLDAALERQHHVDLAARPAIQSAAAADTEVRKIRERLNTLDMRERFALGYTNVGHFRDLADALQQWRRWADGHPMSADNISHVVDILDNASSIDRGDAAALVAPLRNWAAERGQPMFVRSPEPSRSFGIELDL
jgi:predicted  nucleic acid-binding Zn-ribbon protein